MSKVKYISLGEASQNWQISERNVRNYCAQGRVEGTLLEEKIWKIPSTAQKPERKPRHSSAEKTLLSFLKRKKDAVFNKLRKVKKFYIGEYSKVC